MIIKQGKLSTYILMYLIKEHCPIYEIFVDEKGDTVYLYVKGKNIVR